MRYSKAWNRGCFSPSSCEDCGNPDPIRFEGRWLCQKCVRWIFGMDDE